jgi:carbamate kinase
VSRAAAVIAFGGNALIRRDDLATQRQQMTRADDLARALVPLLRERRPLLLVHGNGPQVGDELIRVEEAVTKVPPLSLDLCVAATAGTIGVILDRALRNAAAGAGFPLEVAVMVTLVRVEANDPGLLVPTKPVGPHFTRYRADALRETLGWRMVETGPGIWRKVVPSPEPAEILNLDVLRSLLRPGLVIIAAGGGGVPVVRRADGTLAGVEAVVDKDHVAADLGRDVGADTLLILTDVPHVSLDFGSPTERRLPAMTAAEARGHLRAGQFPAGSMGPKIEAAVRFVETAKGHVLITAAETLDDAFGGHAGTRVIP